MPSLSDSLSTRNPPPLCLLCDTDDPEEIAQVLRDSERLEQIQDQILCDYLNEETPR
jgi:hypothetical protein